MSLRTLLIAAGAAALTVTGASGADAGERWRVQDFGARALAAVAQAGSANVARTSQQGSRNAAAIRQNGAGNVAHTIQRGNDNSAEIGQTGDSNRGLIIQVGNGHSAALSQDGGQRSRVIQINKGRVSVDIHSGQGRPQVSVSGAAGQRTSRYFRQRR